jgi:hypothetical protein
MRKHFEPLLTERVNVFNTSFQDKNFPLKIVNEIE